MTPTRTQATPQLAGVPQQAADEIRVLSQTVHRLTARVEALEKAGFITMQQAEARYAPAVMAQELSATGSAPLNVVTAGTNTFLQAQPVRRK